MFALTLDMGHAGGSSQLSLAPTKQNLALGLMLKRFLIDIDSDHRAGLEYSVLFPEALDQWL
jgi:hypothetical protein